MDKKSMADVIIAMEKSALEKWNKGDPSGYIELFAPHITYFDPFHEHRVDGAAGMTALYENLRGQIIVDRYEMIDPVVQASDNTAALTYHLLSYPNNACERWNCTQVYQVNRNGEWRIIHNHWSLFQPEQVNNGIK